VTAWIVAGFGALVLALGLVGLVRPQGLVGFVKRAWATRGGLYLAVGLRLVLGIALLLAAARSKAPVALAILGWLSLLGAALVPIVGYARARAFVEWWERRPAAFVRGWSLAACAFGVFLAWAVA
jgi:hypothetical protein